MSKFYIGQIFEKKYPPEAADFCNDSQDGENPCSIEEIESLNGVRRFQIVRNPEPTEAETAKNKIIELQCYLNDTDWYVPRSIETEKPIPEEVKIKRAEAREEISKLRKEYNL